MECAAVDGRGGAVHPHGALHAPLRTTDSELRRPSQEKNHRRAVHPEDGGRRRRHEERGARGERWFLKYIVAYLSRGTHSLRSRVAHTDYGTLMDGKCARER